MRRLVIAGMLGVSLLALVVWPALRQSASPDPALAAVPAGTAIMIPTVVATPTTLVGIPLTPNPDSRAPAPVIPPANVSEGIPALIPSDLSTAIGLPTYTEGGVRVQIAALGPKISTWTTPFQPQTLPTVASVEFITAQEVGKRLNRGMNMPNDRLLCFVVLSGQFSGYGLNEPGAATPNPPGNVLLVFDARTGNLLAVTAQR